MNDEGRGPDRQPPQSQSQSQSSWRRRGGRRGGNGDRGNGGNGGRGNTRNGGGGSNRGGADRGDTSWRQRRPDAPPRRAPAPHRINIKEALLEAYKNARNDRAFFDEMRQLQRRYNIPLSQLQTCAMHILSERDDLRLTERLLRDVRDGAETDALVNSSSGPHQYTPLCRALFSGSISMVKLLVAAGADVNFTNGHGEGLETALEAGRATLIEAQPENRIFIEARFKECQDFLTARREWLREQETRMPTAVPWKPRHLRRANNE